MQAQQWAPTGPGKYGAMSTAGPDPSPTALSSVASPAEGAAAETQPWNPENPLFWFAVIGAATFGLMAFSTSVRVGGTTATVAVGTT